MAYKEFSLEELPVKVYKRHGSRSLRLSVSHSGDIRVSIPYWVTYTAGLQFAASRLHWVRQQLPSAPQLLVPGQAIGKSHRLQFVSGEVAKPSVRTHTAEIIVRHPGHLPFSDALVQEAAGRGSRRALKAQADRLLPQRLEQLARQHGYTYRSVRTRPLKSRWGSCDSQQNIVLNVFLMQLPWECIDYVLLHELAHTRVLRHGAPFWAEMERVIPDVRQLRKQMKHYRPLLHAHEPQAVA